jgi:hypothetical protein
MQCMDFRLRGNDTFSVFRVPLTTTIDAESGA